MEMALLAAVAVLAVIAVIQQRMLWDKTRVIRGLQHDPVTGLAFEVLAKEQILRAMRRASNGWKTEIFVVVVFTDAKGLRAVNTECGQAGGDLYLQAHARHLQELVRPPDVVFRRGGGSRADELIAVLVMPIAARDAMKDHRLSRLKAALRAGQVTIQTKSGERKDFLLKPHVGIVETSYAPSRLAHAETDAADELEELLKKADQEMEKSIKEEKK
jgi:diguanylate cyclase (GGDEF)-like protein